MTFKDKNTRRRFGNPTRSPYLNRGGRNREMDGINFSLHLYQVIPITF